MSITTRSQGFGCMGMSAFYTSATTTTDEGNIAVFHEAVARGVKLFNSATFYGPLNEEGFGANLRLIKKCLVGVDRNKIQLMVKVAMDTRCPVDKTGTVWNNRATPEGIRDDVAYALETLGVDYIDIIVLCRVSPDIPIEDSVRGMKAMVDEGKAKFIGLSEASASTIRRANAVHPIYCIEQEWSLWTRDIEAEIVPTCRELGIKVVAYSPLGRGFLTGQLRDLQEANLDPHDYRKFGQPRLSGENLQENLKILDAMEDLAKRKGCSIGQLSLAWLHAQGDDVIPIPGTTKIPHLIDNLAALDVLLSAADLTEIDDILNNNPVKGDRYAHMALTFHANK